MKPKCKFIKICTILYTKNYKSYCQLVDKKIEKCRLIQDIQLNKVSDFVMSLIKKEVDTETIEEHIRLSEYARKVTCPRSLSEEIKILDSCNIKDCTYFSKKMSFNCMIIHTNIFFPEKTFIPDNVLEVGLDKTKKSLARLTYIGLVLSRMFIILYKYYADVNNLRDKFPYLRKEEILICPICHKQQVSEICDCIKDSKLRKSRLNFEKRWKASVKDAHKKNKKVLNTQVINGEIYTLSYLRANLFRLYFYNIKLLDVPFGYIFYAYHKLFNHTKNIYEDLGLTENLYNIATKLFLQEGLESEDS
jgi:hypothetical protein